MKTSAIARHPARLLVIALLGASIFAFGRRAPAADDPKPPQEQTQQPVPPADPKLEPTHAQTAVIQVTGDKGQPLPLHTFCLTQAGQILAGVGETSGEIRVYDADGKPLGCWPVPVKPEAVNVAPDGTVYVAGNGRLLKLDPQGKVVLQKEAPHAAALRSDATKLRDEVVAQAKQRLEIMGRQEGLYKRQIERLQAELKKLTDKPAETLTDVDKKRIESYTNSIPQYERAIESVRRYLKDNPAKELTEEEIQQQVDRMVQSKMALASIAATEGNVFLTCRAAVGYGFEVWRTGRDFENGTRIVSGLLGCCGQMDVQASSEGLFVAENARARVCRYDLEGKLVCQWGEKEREGVVGFGSCCNPMNVAFGPQQQVYTAEATLGRIKRFTATGEFLGLVGSVDIVPGCKNVAIAVSQDGSRVYMLDITRSHIVVMSVKPAAAPSI